MQKTRESEFYPFTENSSFGYLRILAYTDLIKARGIPSDMRKELSYVLDYALNNGFQIHPDAFKILENVSVQKLEKIIKDIIREKKKKKLFQINQDDLETYLGIKEDPTLESEVQIISDPTNKVASGEGIQGYNALFASRYKKLRQVISARPESKMLKQIAVVKSTKSNDDRYVCGLLTLRTAERNITKLSIEDPSGSIDGVIFDKELQGAAATLLIDQFVMARIAQVKTGFVIKDLILPDIPDYKHNRSSSDVFAVFLSDLHIGSKYFMEDEFSEFVSWLSSPDPVARKVRFVLICGDLVDGVGIYPNQNKELQHSTIKAQLEKTEELLDKIPKNVKIVIIPGNHDPGRRALPQPAIPDKHNPSLSERDNIIMVGNPALVSLNGVKVMMFHGQSIDDIVKSTPGLSYDKPTNVMRQLLRARHLSPIYGSQTPIAPETEDHMVIEDVPDIFHVGHVHRAEFGKYRGVFLVNSGSWQKQTPFQASVGMVPNPGIAILINLKSFEIFHENYNSNSKNVMQS